MHETSNAGGPRERCATHGMLYDPTLHEGCALCRRLVAPTDAKGEVARTRFSPLRLLLGLTLVLVSAWLTFTMTRGRIIRARAASSLGAGATCASESCRPEADECFDDCGDSDGRTEAACARACLAAFGDCVERCEPPVRVNLAGFAVIGGDEAEGAGEDALMPVLGGLRDPRLVGKFSPCREFTRGYVRVVVDGETGRPRDAHVRMYPDSAEPCAMRSIAEHRYLEHDETYTIYAVVK